MVIPLRPAVFYTVRLADGIMPFLIKYKSGCHIAWDKADLNLHPDKLHRDVIADAADGNSGIFADLAVNAVQEAFIQPFCRWHGAGLASGGFVLVKRLAPDAGVERQVIRTDVVTENTVELFQGMDGIHVEAVDEAFFAASPEPFLFPF